MNRRRQYSAGLQELILLLVVILATVPSGRAPAQMDTVVVPSDLPPGEGNLNNAIAEKISAGALSSTVFKLELFGYYVLTGPIVVPAGTRLTIVAPDPGPMQQLAPPQILWSSGEGIQNRRNFDCFGDISLKNVWLLYANTIGWQTGTSLTIEDSPDTIKGQVGEFEGVIFDYSNCPSNGSGAVGITSRHFKGTFRNCYFRNCIDFHYRYYGRAVSFPFASEGWHIDSLSFEHCTFANIGMVYSQQGKEYADVVLFNHCTFLNTVLTPIESGWWRWFSITNSIFMNPSMFGDLPVLRHNPSYPEGAIFYIDSISAFGFPVPFSESERHILFAHNSYLLEDWLKDHMAQSFSPYDPDDRFQPRPQPFMSEHTRAFFNDKSTWPFISMEGIHDSTDPAFVFPPTNVAGIKRFVYFKWYDAQDTNWAFDPQSGLNGIWPMSEDLSYTNPVLLEAGMGRFPLGDLFRWFPGTYTRWKNQEGDERARIAGWLATGVDPGDPVAVNDGRANALPSESALHQNYPNPFNPETMIEYSIAGSGTSPAPNAVRLAVYDLLGREVAVLVNERQPAGQYSVKFDGSSLSSGVYLCRLVAGERMEARKMIFLK